MTREEAYIKALELHRETYQNAKLPVTTAMFSVPAYRQVLEIADWLLYEERLELETEEAELLEPESTNTQPN